MSIKLTLDGKEYVANLADLLTKVTIGEIRTIKRETGLTIEDVETRLTERSDGDADDWDVYAAMVYLILSRAGGHVTWDRVEMIPLAELAAGFTIVPDDEPALVEAPVTEPVMAGGDV